MAEVKNRQDEETYKVEEVFPIKSKDDNKEKCELHQMPEEVGISRLQIISAILGLLNAVCWIIWVIWVIGYSVYCIINNIEVYEGVTYAMVTTILTLTLNIFIFLFKISGHKEKEKHNG